MNAVSSRFLYRNIESLIGLGLLEKDLLNLVPGGTEALHNPLIRFDGNILVRILKFAENFTHDSAIGFRCGLNYGNVDFGDVTYAILFCNNLRESFELSRNFEPLAQQFGYKSLSVEGNDANISWTTYEDTPEKLRHISDLNFATFGRMGLWIKAAHGLTVKNLQVRHTDDRYKTNYENVLNCPVIYGASQNVLTFDKAFLDIPLPGKDPKTLKLLVAKLERDFELLGQPLSEVEMVQICLESSLGKSPPTISRAASMIEIPEWQLRRKLKSQGSSFREILENVRKERYALLIQQTSLSQVQIAGLLGYSEQSALSRAYKKWHGSPPIRPKPN